MDFGKEIDKLTNLPPELRERLKQQHAERQAKENERIEKYKQQFQFSDSAMGTYRGSNGLINPDSIFVIRKWQNGYGDIVYTKTTHDEKDPSGDAIRDLSVRIKDEQGRFTGLDTAEQSRIRSDSLAGKTDPRFGVYLSNEALRQTFTQLKR